MDAHHASLGRRRLEEIRQKRETERLNSSTKAGLFGLGSESQGSSWNVNQISERDSHAPGFTVKDSERKVKDLEEENKRLVSKLEVKEMEHDALQKQLKDLEHGELQSLRKAVKDLSMEKNAAVVAREDLLAQLRGIKKQLKEAEEEQYRAEEDSASLRAEITLLHQQLERHQDVSLPSIPSQAEQIQVMEQELVRLKRELQQESILRQQEQQMLADERARTATLATEKQDLEGQLAALSKKVSDQAVEDASRKAFSKEEKQKIENQMHELAVMVERLEMGRQKLLVEIDSQSSEIERLFEENSDLSASYKDTMLIASQWENQVKDCLKQNEELRATLNNLRAEQAKVLRFASTETESGTKGGGGSSSGSEVQISENLILKEELGKEHSKAEALAAEVMRLSTELKRAMQAYDGLIRLYKPIFWDIENSLIKMKRDPVPPVH